MSDITGKTGNQIKGLTLNNLGIAGPKGEDGVGVASIVMNQNFELIIYILYFLFIFRKDFKGG